MHPATTHADKSETSTLERFMAFSLAGAPLAL
jgi:hypothetical protein